ncbi:hypothetical protein RAMLITH_13610 [Ramlibacter sp. RBP-2]|uniref:SLATT domain-containing protein n=1 Tax=Ramlibacter lithotrophicus TaxID=2606681 RepID=A0A7X6I712_9BURK|nr:hypothetical protein [Ramlibacter lithotrophicus]NKE66861.1 hypothetical protein [Ramlibacter lithotrophicus]
MENSDLLDLAEKAGYENLRGHLAHAETLAREATSTATLLLAGTGGALTYAIRWFDTTPASPAVWGAVATTAWLATLSATLVIRCLRTVRTEMLYNEPLNLYKPDLNIGLTEARRWELENLQDRITLTKTRNKPIARWLDRVRIAAAATPLVFLGAAALGAYL